MLKEEVLKKIKTYNLIEKNDKVVIGVSGGPDSICLLHLLYSIKKELGFEIVVAHINHQIREVADSETEYVKDFCKNLEIECFVKKENILELAKEQKKGTEEAGRQVRYDFFEDVAQKTNSNKIATAHNSNDRAETVILNILRGSGISGLKGIEAMRDNKYIRPLIFTKREKIEEYCQENNLNPKIDESNMENIYNRNKVRNIIIPYIEKEFNKNIIQTINRLSDVATEENEFLQKLTEEQYNAISTIENDTIILDLKKFNKLELVIKRRLILYTINEAIHTTNGIEKVNIDDIIKLCKNNIGNKYLSPIKLIKIYVKKGKIDFIKNLENN